MSTATVELTREETAGKAAGTAPQGERLASLDALRGFDMFWITGGEGLFLALAKATGWAWVAAVVAELKHASWAGFQFYDLIFPMFVFISGVTLPMMIGKRLARGEGSGRIAGRLLRRALLLVALGVIYNTKKITWDVETIRFGSVLGRIGLASCGAGLVVLLARGVKAQAAVLVAILALYGALLMFVPVPGVGKASIEKGKNWADYVDQKIMPGKLYEAGVHDPEGLMSTLPAVGSALLGALAGAWLICGRKPWVKALGLAAAGAALWGLGKAWGLQLPVIKKIWTSSFVLVAGGWSCMFLAAFYLVMDVIRLRRWAFLFVLIGLNPLTLYFLRGTKIIDFKLISDFFFGFAMKYAPAVWQPVWVSVALLGVQFAFLYFLYRKKIFMRA